MGCQKLTYTTIESDLKLVHSKNGVTSKSSVLNARRALEYRIHDASIGRFLSRDPLAKQFAWNSPYAFAENKVIQGTDKDGLSWNPVSGIGEGIARSVESSIKSISSSISSAVNSTKLAIINNKDVIIGVSQQIQQFGETTTKLGLTGAAVTAVAAATGVGSVAPASGLVVAGIGGLISTLGAGIEIATNAISGDYEKVGKDVTTEVVGAIAGKTVDVLIPGPNPNVAPVVKDLFEVGKEVVKDNFSNSSKSKVKEIVD